MIIHFDKMSVRLPIGDGETAEEIEDRMIEAIDSVGEGVVMSYRIALEDDDVCMRRRSADDTEQVVHGLYRIGGFIADRLGHADAAEYLRAIDMAIALIRRRDADGMDPGDDQ